MNPQGWLRLAMAVSILLLASFWGLVCWNSHEELYHDADQALMEQTKEIAANLSEILHASDLVGQLLDQSLSSLSWDEITRSEFIHHELRRLNLEIPGSSITIIRPDGMIANSTRNWSHTRLSNIQPFVTAAGANGRYITPAYIGALSGQQKFSYIFRRSTRDDSSNGAIVISTPVASLAATFDLNHAVQSLVVRDDDGQIVASIPEGQPGAVDPHLFDKSHNKIKIVQLPSGVALRSSAISLPNYHLTIGGLIPNSLLLRRWAQDMVAPTLMFFISGVLIVGVLQIAVRAIDRRDAARQELRLAEQVVHQNQHLEALGQLTAGVAHDFNNIMAIILGNVELLREKSNGQWDRRVDAIASAVNRGQRLVKHLLSFTRRQMILPELLDVNQILLGLEPIMKSSLGGLVKLKFQLCDLSLSCLFDATEFELAVINICNNARQCMPDGGKFTVVTERPTLKAQNELDLLPGDYAHISLIDTGEGMSSHVMQRAFEPFFTTRGLHEGTGIGLSQVYGFCKQARGMVALQSVVGKGTTVGMYLPIVMVPPVRPSSGDNMTRTVLVVEDNTELLEVVEEILSDVGWTVFTATNGTKGLLALKERGAQITLLLTDVVMPDVSGIELASRARDTYPHIKVLLMTGFADVQTGVLPLVRKPFRRKELIEAISRVMADTGIGRWTNA